MAYLRLLANPDDDNAFLRIINVPRRKIGPGTLEKLGLYSQNRESSLGTVINEIGIESVLSGGIAGSFASVCALDGQYSPPLCGR
jgi:ATP-dependent DNA helicase Rep